MFTVSQYLLQSNGIKTSYAVVTGIVLYSIIYLYFVYFNSEFLGVFNTFTRYILVVDVLLAIFYHYRLKPAPKVPTPVPKAPTPVPKDPEPVPKAPEPVPKDPEPAPKAPEPKGLKTKKKYKTKKMSSSLETIPESLV